MSAGRMTMAVLVLSALSLALHRYVWARLVRDAAWGQPWAGVLTVLIVVLAAAVPLTFVAQRWLPRPLNSPLAWVVYIWLGFALYLFFLSVLTDAGRGRLA